MILKFLLQPIVENSIIHGLDDVVHKVTIKICVYIEDDFLIVTITDNGKGFDETQLEKSKNKDLCSKKLAGIGVPNVNERIKLNFGNIYGITIKSRLGFGTEVHMKLPVKTEKGEGYVQGIDC